MTALYCLLLLPIGAALVVTGLSYAAFALTLGLGRQTFFPRPWAGRGLSGLLKGLGSAVVGLGVMMAAYPLGAWLSARSRGVSCAAGETVVVCLHGLYHNPSAFLAIRPALVRAGFSRVILPGYRSHGTDFEAEVRRVAAFLDQTVPADARLCFLGHSLGGLVARRLAAEPHYARRTLAVVTLGTPHQGSVLARLAVGRLGRALVPGSPLLARIAALADPPGATLVAVVSPVDNLVVPDSGLDPAREGWQVVATPPVAHVAMLYHRDVIAMAVAILVRATQPPIRDRAREGAA